MTILGSTNQLHTHENLMLKLKTSTVLDTATATHKPSVSWHSLAVAIHFTSKKCFPLTTYLVADDFPFFTQALFTLASVPALTRCLADTSLQHTPPWSHTIHKTWVGGSFLIIKNHTSYHNLSHKKYSSNIARCHSSLFDQEFFIWDEMDSPHPECQHRMDNTLPWWCVAAGVVGRWGWDRRWCGSAPSQPHTHTPDMVLHATPLSTATEIQYILLWYQYTIVSFILTKQVYLFPSKLYDLRSTWIYFFAGIPVFLICILYRICISWCKNKLMQVPVPKLFTTFIFFIFTLILKVKLITFPISDLIDGPIHHTWSTEAGGAAGSGFQLQGVVGGAGEAGTVGHMALCLTIAALALGARHRWPEFSVAVHFTIHLTWPCVQSWIACSTELHNTVLHINCYIVKYIHAELHTPAQYWRPEPWLWL